MIRDVCSGMNNRMSLLGTILLVLPFGACAHSAGAQGEASDEQPGLQSLIVVNANGGLLYGTGVPDSWTWLDKDTVEICSSVNILRNEVGSPPMDRDCAPRSISGKQLDLDGDGTVDVIETFEVLDPLFYRERPRD